MKFNQKLKESFLELIDNTDKTENDIQRFLEEHTELIPLPFLLGHQLNDNAIISKFKLGNEYITDFTYLTKCSDCWYIVFIELEDSEKKLFTNNQQNVEFSAEFNHAMDQITSWKAYADDNKSQILYQLQKLMYPLQRNPVEFRYVLIIGRNKEKENHEHRTKMFNKKNSADTKVMTYDSIISTYEHSHELYEKIILTTKGDQGFKIKHLPKKKISTTLFGQVSQEFISIKKSDIEKLKKQGYEMDAWLDGKLLTWNNKTTEETGWKTLGGGT